MATATVINFPHRARIAVFVACAGLGGCGGTPTADPPDFLPTPSIGRIGVGPEVVSTSSPQSAEPIELSGVEGAVDGSAELFIVNLDRMDEDPQVINPNADGSFSTKVVADVGDRVRLVSRTEERHSLPLDLEAVRGLNVVALSPLQDQGLGCLEITPKDELDLGDDRRREQRFTVDNQCTGEITIDRAVLRFGTPKLILVSPATIARGAKTDIALSLAGDLSEELWDILLLDVSVNEERGRYALSVWAR